MDQMSWLKTCAKLGLDGVELLGGQFPGIDHDYLVDLKRTCAELNLTIAMVSADGHLTGIDDAERDKEVSDIIKWIEVAQFLGAPRVRFFCGPAEELDAGEDELYEKVKAAIGKIVSVAAENNIVMGLENHSGVKADRLLAMLDDVGSEFFKLTLDTGNFPPTSHVGPETYSSIERCAPHATIVHAKFMDINEDGSDCEFDWRKIHGILKKVGYEGFLSIEYEGADADEAKCVKRIVKFLRSLE